VPGGSATSFLMTVTNNGPDAASAVHLVNTVGGNLTLTGATCAASGGAVCPTTGAVMDVSSLPAGGALAFTVNANVAAGTQGTITNAMTASVTSGNRASVSGVAVGSAYSNSVSVTGSASPALVYAGQTANFAMTVANAGPGPAQNVALTNTLGSGLSAGGDIGCVASGGAVCPASPASSMTITTLPANGALTFTVPAVVNAGVNGSVGNTMSASVAGDTRSTDNSATATTTGASVDVTVVASGPSRVTIGSNAVFTAVISNPGPSAVYNLGYTTTLSGAGAGTGTVSCTASAGATCPSAGGTTTLPAGRSLTLTITVPAVAYGPITSSTTISADGEIGRAHV
jgi:uncharacterized repeat protein (TIGR01451 family)